MSILQSESKIHKLSQRRAMLGKHADRKNSCMLNQRYRTTDAIRRHVKFKPSGQECKMQTFRFVPFYLPSILVYNSPPYHPSHAPGSSCRRRYRSRGSAAARTGRPGSRRKAARKRLLTHRVGPIEIPAQTLWRQALGGLRLLKNSCTAQGRAPGIR
jgi:hypothetical protein